MVDKIMQSCAEETATMRNKINIGKFNGTPNINVFLDKLYKHLKYDRGQSDNSINNSLIRARVLLTKYKPLQFTVEQGQTIWMDYEAAGAAPQTTRHMLHTLEQIAASQGVTLKLKKPKLIKKEVDYLSLPEVKAVIEAADNQRDVSIITLLFFSGVRASECTRINIDDLNIKTRILMIRGQTKNRKERPVVLTKECMKSVEEWLAIRPDVECNALFLNQYGERMTRSGLYKILHNAGLRAGLDKPVYCHLMRHSCGSALVKSGVPINVTMKHLGHSSINTTMRYVHANMQEVQELIDDRFVL
ncbi:tyrosine-type recombinase/integrase [Methanocella sp. MCL-LM]|uniref:tyrosine-type recombinase/integrase n=1 Tax=Methanocella sp. MCL-LM TaxID=3412035 RepID=UPI003C7845BE